MLVRSCPVEKFSKSRLCDKTDIGSVEFSMTFTWAGIHVRLAPNVLSYHW